MKKFSLKKTLSVFLAVLMVALIVPMSVLAVAAEEEPVAATIVGVESTNGAKTTGGVTYLLDWAIDGDMTTTYIAANESSLKYGVTDGVFGDGDTYRDYITVELNALSTLESVTIWAGDDKASKAFFNHAFDVYYSADGETWTLHSQYENVCGDNTNPGAGSAAFTEERLVNWPDEGEFTHYGLKLDMDGATVKYVRIAVITGRIDRGWANLRDIEVDGVECATTEEPTPETPTPEEPTPETPTPEDPTPEEPTPETPTPETPTPETPTPETPTPEEPTPETPVGPAPFGIQSVEMPWISFDQLVGASADKEACAAKMFDGDIDSTVVWRNNNRYDPSDEQIANGQKQLEYVMSMVDGQMVAFDGEASANDYYDYVIMDLSNDTENKTYDVSILRWWIADDTACFSKSYAVYASADGETWTLCESFEDMISTWGTEYAYDKENDCLYHDIEVNQEGVRYVMLAINYGRTSHDFLFWNVKELVVYEKGTEPQPEQKPSTDNSGNDNNNTNNNTNNNNTNNNTNNSNTNNNNANTNTDTQTPEDTTEVTSGGCGGSIGMGVVAVIATAGAALTFARKRKED